MEIYLLVFWCQMISDIRRVLISFSAIRDWFWRMVFWFTSPGKLCSNCSFTAWLRYACIIGCSICFFKRYVNVILFDAVHFVQDFVLYLFFESKSTTTMKGDIGVARSFDHGGTWEFLGIALEEPWHLSYPFVFSYQNQVNESCHLWFFTIKTY